MILPETFIARDILRRQWGIDADLLLLSMSDNGCSWFCEADNEAYVLKAAPLEWHRMDETYKAWNDAGRLCDNAVPFWPLSGGGHIFSDGQWAWTVQCWQPGRRFDGSWQDAELVARHIRTFTQALANPSQAWVLAERSLYANLSATERAKVNDWLIANRMAGQEWANVQQALGSLMGWYAERLPPCGPVIVHYDLHPGNCIITDETVVFIDPSLAYGSMKQALAFAATRFWPQEPGRFLALCGVTDGWQAYVRRETVMRISWLLRVNYVLGGNSWRHELRKHLEALG